MPHILQVFIVWIVVFTLPIILLNRYFGFTRKFYVALSMVTAVCFCLTGWSISRDFSDKKVIFTINDSYVIGTKSYPFNLVINEPLKIEIRNNNRQHMKATKFVLDKCEGVTFKGQPSYEIGSISPLPSGDSLTIYTDNVDSCNSTETIKARIRIYNDEMTITKPFKVKCP